MAMLNRHVMGDTDASPPDYDSFNNIHVHESVVAQDRIDDSLSATFNLAQALITYVPTAPPDTIEQRRTEDVENINLLNILSRVVIATTKYPDEATLHNYDNLQMWMYRHANKHAPVDICESLARMFLLHPNHSDNHKLFNLHLLSVETYQTIGHIDQARCQFDQAEMITKKLDDATTERDKIERDRKRKKLEDIRMKIAFQLDFQRNLIQDRKRQRSNLLQDNFLEQLCTNNPSSEECRYIWRQIVLQCVLNSRMTIPSAHWLLSYASRLPSNTLQHANSLYVALNLFLLGYGSTIFEQQQHLNIDVFKVLDDVGRYFDENCHQSKQFSPVHKMAHVWGTAVVAFHLASDENRYLVCASMMRVSFELLDICFLSSGIESLYILGRTHASEFFTMMTNAPSLKLISPDCMNYFRRQVKTNDTCIRYSIETVDRFVLDVFNSDQSDNRV